MEQSGYASQATPTDVDPTPSEATVTAAYRCAHCGRLSIGYRDYSLAWLHNVSSLDLYDVLDHEETRWLPRRGSAPQYPDVPAHIGPLRSRRTSAIASAPTGQPCRWPGQ